MKMRNGNNKMKIEKFRWYLSQKQGWIKIFPGDRDWKFGVSKPLETKELQRIDRGRSIFVDK